MKPSPIRIAQKIALGFVKVFSLKEKILILVLLSVMLSTGFLSLLSFFDVSDSSISGSPTRGGSVIEGMVGRPQLINPVLAKSDLDRSIVSLVFAGLMKTNEKQEVVPYLASNYEASPDKQTYTVKLREDLRWQDGEKITAEDVLYTVAVVQNPDYNGALKETWAGVRAEKVDDLTVRFVLPRAYPLFLNALTVGLLPRHLWVDVAVRDFATYPLNLKPVGAGPYLVSKITQDEDGGVSMMQLSAFDGHSLRPAYISRFDIRFYENRGDLVKGLTRREVSSVGLFSFDDELAGDVMRGYTNHTAGLPQYIGLFFNMKKPGGSIVADRAVREAVAYGINKDALRQAGSFSAGEVIDSPILKGYLGATDDIQKYSRDTKIAQSLLSQSGWNDLDGNGIREKDGRELVLLLAIPQDSQFERIADELADQLEVIGIRLDVRKSDANTFEQEYLASRNYDLVVIGENLGLDADPYSYWHSSQINFPGLNLSMFENGEVDKLLEEARQTTDTNLKIRSYEKFQQIIAQELPAIMLYQPVYIYKVSNQIKGVNIAGITNTWDRFSGVAGWYTNTR